MIRRLLIAVGIVFGLLFCLAAPALAILDPDTLTIDGVYVYRNCLVDGDQLYVVQFTVDYTGANPGENINQAFIGRLMDGATEVASVRPVAFYDAGYDHGVMSFYLQPADALTWGGSYTVSLTGDPSLAWGGVPPSVSESTFDLWSASTTMGATKYELSARILWLAAVLEYTWIAQDLVDTQLTDTGVLYFQAAIPNARIMAPYAFSGFEVQPEFPQKEYTQDYAQQLADSVNGTPLDLTDTAAIFGLSRMWINGIIWLGLSIALLYFLVRLTNSTKYAVLVSVPLIAGGALLGMIPLVLAVILGFMALVLTGWILFAGKATA